MQMTYAYLTNVAIIMREAILTSEQIKRICSQERTKHMHTAQAKKNTRTLHRGRQREQKRHWNKNINKLTKQHKTKNPKEQRNKIDEKKNMKRAQSKWKYLMNVNISAIISVPYKAHRFYDDTQMWIWIWNVHVEKCLGFGFLPVLVIIPHSRIRRRSALHG